eukprot:PhF_6_TR42847/c0_g1_i1/m.64889
MIEGARLGYLQHHAGQVSTEQVLYVQTFRTPLLDTYLRFLCDLGSGTGYTIALPLIIWSGYLWCGIHFCVLLSLGLYLTDIIKDAFALPRPPSPPVAKAGEAHFAQEYGMPSTHTCLAVLVAFFLVYLSFTDPQPTYTKMALAWIVGTLYAVQVGIGRVYLGMHFPSDVYAGIMCSVVIAVLWCGGIRGAVDWALDPLTPTWLATATSVFAAHLLIVLHASPPDPCPCFLDSVRFISTNVGAILGGRIGVMYVTVPSSYTSLGLRLLVGISLIAIAKVAAGPLAEYFFRFTLPPISRGLYLLRSRIPPVRWMGYTIASVIGILLGKSLSRSQGSVTQESRDGESLESPLPPSSPSPPGDDALWSTRNHGHWHDWDVYGKFVSYAIVGAIATRYAPESFSYLGI